MKHRDDRHLLNLPKPDATPTVHERETIRSEGSSMQLERIGESHQGDDGKHYIGSMAVHIYEVAKFLGAKEYIYLFQSTDITQIPETVAAAALPELGRVIMQRYGRKPPAKTTDKNVRESEIVK